MTRLSSSEAVAALQSGDVVLMDTDTLPGLHALATVPGAAQRLSQLKQSPPDRPYLLLVDSVDAALRLGRPATADQERQLRELWPGPLTALLNPADSTPEAWVFDGRSVAVRVPAPGALSGLLSALGGVLFSTSANLAGQTAAEDLDSATAVFPGVPVVNLRIESSGSRSTIVDFTVNPPNLVRSGILGFDPDSSPQRHA